MSNRIFTLLTLAVCLTQALSQTTKAPGKAAVNPQKEALDSLRAILASKSDVNKNDDQFKEGLIQWVQATDTSTLRVLIPRLQVSSSGCAVKPRTASNTFHHRKQPSTYEDIIPPQLILKKLEAMTNESSTEQLKVFLAAMNTADGKRALQKLNIKQTVIEELSKQANGDVEQQNKAKNTFKVLLQSITKKELPALRPVYKVYLQYSLRLKATQTVSKATPDQLKALLEILSKAEKRYSFRGVKFSNLLTQAKEDAKLQKAVDSFNTWISKADIKSLRRVVHYITVNERPVKTLEEIKALVTKKIESKTPVQLTEFLEVFETVEGKVLLTKLSVRPTASPQDLIKQLKSGVKEDEVNVKKILKDWINKLTVNDMNEFQRSGQLFLQYRARKAAMEAVQKADQTTLLSILEILSKKESQGVKFDGIKFTDLKNKLQTDGSKALQETKRAMIDWVLKIKYEQLVTLQKAHPDTPRSVSSSSKSKTAVVVLNQNKPVKNQPVAAAVLIKPASSPSKSIITAPKPPITSTSVSTETQKPATSTTSKPSSTTTKNIAPQKKTKLAAVPQNPTNPGVKNSGTTIKSVAEIKTAAQFEQLMLGKTSLPVSQVNVQKALKQVCSSASNEDINAVFTIARKGLTGHVTKLLNEGLFKVQVTRMSERIKNTSKPADWTTLRADLNKWIGKWKSSQIILFSTWYKRGAEGKK